ncbi:MAG: response regulator [Spirochaetia bacterium]|jgi:PAS domain S-box-containing protein
MSLQNREIRILLVEDSQDDAALLLRTLERHGFALDHRRVESFTGLSEALKEETWDVVLIDYSLPSFTGLEALSVVKASSQRPGVVMVSGTISEDTAVQTLGSGAHDYVLKDNLKRLGPAVDHALREARHRIHQEWAESELRKSEEKYRKLHQSMRDAFVHVDLDGRILDTNEVFQEMVGYGAEELSASQYTSLIPEKWHAREAEIISTQVLARGYSDVYEKEYRRKNGTTVAVETRRFLLRDSDGKPASIWSTVRDITERKETEERLLGLARFSDENPQPVMRATPTGSIIYSNRASEGLVSSWTGKVPEEYLGAVASAWETGKKQEIEIQQGSKSYSVTFVPFVAAGYINLYGREVTEEKALAAQLNHAQKMEAIGELAGGVAHDFNNILTAIIGFGTFLQLKLKNNEPLRHSADQIILAAERAAELTQNLLVFSRKQITAPKPVNLNAIIGQVEKFLLRIIGEDIQLKTSLHPEELVVLADSGQVEQVLMNLATNAKDAMPGGGSIIIATSSIELDEKFIALHGYGKTGLHALLSFEDTGCGMDKSTQERIFEPFFTTKEVGKGTGLGLSIVYGIVKQHNGFINVYSELNKGTTFRVYLPLTQSAVAGKKLEKAMPAEGGTETILLGEDDPGVRELTRIFLEESGYSVIEAVDGDEAIAVFKDNQGRIDLVILDIVMPKRSGKSVADEIRVVNPKISVLFVSGYTANIIHQNGILEEGLNFISKPFSPEALLRKVREVLDH